MLSTKIKRIRELKERPRFKGLGLEEISITISHNFGKNTAPLDGGWEGLGKVHSCLSPTDRGITKSVELPVIFATLSDTESKI